jgi:tol-pal system protein YbgF
MKRYQPLAFFAAIFLLLGAVSPGSNDKELIIRLQGEVIVLQRQVRDMQEFLDKWQARSSDSLNKISSDVGLMARGVNTLEDSFKTSELTLRNNASGTANQINRIAEQVSANNQQSTQIKQQLADLQRAVQQLQTNLENKERNETPNSAAVANDPEYLFATAYTQFNRRNYESAINLFGQYLQLNNRSEKADDALFWIAESHFAQGRYDEALRHYEQALTDHPRGDKVPASLLKKGLSLLRLERRDEGTTVLKSLVNQHANSSEANTARDELRRLGEGGQALGTRPPGN